MSKTLHLTSSVVTASMDNCHTLGGRHTHELIRGMKHLERAASNGGLDGFDNVLKGGQFAGILA